MMVQPYRFASGGDPDFASVGLLLHMDGANGGTSFPDNSANAHTVSRVGVTTDTTTPKFGSASALISTVNGANVLTVPHHASLSALTGDLTIEMWVYLTTINRFCVFYSKQTGTGFSPYELYVTAGNKLGFLGFNSATALLYNLVGTTSLQVNTWHFVQGRRSGATFACALDGAQEATTTPANDALFNAADPTVIGNFNSVSNASIIGKVDDARFTKGVARAFAVPTAAFPNS